FQNEKNYSNGLKAVLELYKKDKDPAVIHKMLESIQEMDFTNYQIESLTKMLAKTELSLSEITKNIENETTRTRVSKTYLANQLSVNDIVKDLKEFGLSQGLSQDQIKNIDTEDTYGSSLAYSVLEASDVFLWFDAETGFIPCEYDALIKDFESISQGKLKLNVWMDAQMSSDDYTTYKIYVAANDKIYIMEPEDIGDWYDVEMVFGLMNKIAAEAGISEEYVFIDTGDQTVMAMFGNKSKVEAFANKYQL
ncbi:MAG: hypothetical protein MRY83_13575, partial [Flavobacteriales bacterium]|nr:hypothetical protein [Flavobacteriales bacterium]